MGRPGNRSSWTSIDDFDKVAWGLSVLSHAIRTRVIASLRTGKASFTQLLEHTGLDPARQCGLLDYHLQYLLQSKVIEKAQGGYALTKRGEQISSLLERLTHLSGQPIMEKEDQTMSKRTGGLEVRKLSEKDIESFLDFFLARWEMEPKYREAERNHILSWIRERNSTHFVAWRPGKIVGWLHGKIVSLSFGPSVGQAAGEEGWIEDIVVEKPGAEGMEGVQEREEIAGALIDAYEEFLMSRSRCVGVKATRIAPEALPYHPEIFRLLQRKGFLVANISYEMEKQFPGKLDRLLQARAP